MIKIYLKRLKDIREDKDLTQKEIAEYLKITQQQYSLYEKGKRTIPSDLLIELAKYYNVSIDYITELTNTIKPVYTIKNQVNISGNKIKGNINIK